MKKLSAALFGATSLAAYSFIEPRLFRLGNHLVPVPLGAPPLRILHLGDTHMSEGSHPVAGFVRSLPERMGFEPDLVVATGDLIDQDSGIEQVLDSFSCLSAKLGKFYVLGSHDYFSSEFKSPSRYLTGRRAEPSTRVDTARLEEGLQKGGWKPLTNLTEHALDGTIRLAGVDDPYINRQRTGHIERAEQETLAIGVTHAPDVVSDWLLNGYDLVLAGHTHGGQLRAPFLGALVTNSTIPAALAAGLHPVGNGWLHITPGLGHSRHTPVRFLCRPEATLLELLPTP